MDSGHGTNLASHQSGGAVQGPTNVGDSEGNPESALPSPGGPPPESLSVPNTRLFGGSPIRSDNPQDTLDHLEVGGSPAALSIPPNLNTQAQATPAANTSPESPGRHLSPREVELGGGWHQSQDSQEGPAIETTSEPSVESYDSPASSVHTWDSVFSDVEACEAALKKCAEKCHPLAVAMVCLSVVPRCWKGLILRCPVCVVIVGLLAAMATCGLGMIVFTPTIQTNFDEFMRADGEAALKRDSYLEALDARKSPPRGRRMEEFAVADMEEEEDQEERRLSLTFFVTIDFHLIYEAIDGHNALYEDSLHEARGVEKNLRNLPGWKDLCNKTHPEMTRACNPGFSFLNYVFPQLSGGGGGVRPESLVFDGSGSEAQTMSFSINKAKDDGLLDLYFPKDFDGEAVKPRSKVFRTLLRFRFQLGGGGESQADIKKERKDILASYARLLEEELYPFISTLELEKLRVFYGGNDVDEIETLSTLFSDIRLAAGSMIFVWCYMLFHTQSIFLSLMGLILIFLAIPLAYVLFAAFSGSTELSIASFLSLFLIVGLGSDVVFVFTDFWRQSVEVGPIKERLDWTYMHAGKATAATTMTTAVSFIANLASVLRPLREFGLFMGLCVALAFFLLLLLFPPVCIIADRWLGCRILCCCRRRRHRKAAQDGMDKVQLFFYKHWCFFVGRWRWSCILVFIALSVGALMGSVENTAIASGVPKIFPDDHNQIKGKEIAKSFTVPVVAVPQKERPPKDSGMVCNELAFDNSECALTWCEHGATFEVSGDSSHCECFRRSDGDCTNPDKITTYTRFIGLSHTDSLAGFPYFLTQGYGYYQANSKATLSPLVLQEWESGETSVEPVEELGATVSGLHPGGSQSCVWDQLCYCGTRRCNTGGLYLGQKWPSVGLLDVAVRRLQSAAPESGLIATPKVPRNLRAQVEVLFGLEIEGGLQLLGKSVEKKWVFKQDFDASEAWAQRHIFKFCRDLKAELKVVEKLCWIEDFRDWVVQQGVKFPTAKDKFVEQVISFTSMGMTGKQSSGEFLWYADGKIKAMRLAFLLDLSKMEDAKTILKMKEQWDAYVDQYNRGAERYTGEVWHTSDLWVRAEAEVEIVASTLSTLAISVSLAFLGMLVFTEGNVILAMYVVFCTIGVICCLAFFILVLMGWPLGPIEVIALIVFVGYSVTYSLHIAHKYGDAAMITEEEPSSNPGSPKSASQLGHEGPDKPARRKSSRIGDDLSQGAHLAIVASNKEIERDKPWMARWSENRLERFERTRFALQRMGGAALGSAATTIGSAIFLLFCTLTVFWKLGTVVLTVTLLSIIYALIPLPAILVACGPPWRIQKWARGVKQNAKDGVSSRLSSLKNMIRKRRSHKDHHHHHQPGRHHDAGNVHQDGHSQPHSLHQQQYVIEHQTERIVEFDEYHGGASSSGYHSPTSRDGPGATGGDTRDGRPLLSHHALDPEEPPSTDDEKAFFSATPNVGVSSGKKASLKDQGCMTSAALGAGIGLSSPLPAPNVDMETRSAAPSSSSSPRMDSSYPTQHGEVLMGSARVMSGGSGGMDDDGIHGVSALISGYETSFKTGTSDCSSPDLKNREKHVHKKVVIKHLKTRRKLVQCVVASPGGESYTVSTSNAPTEGLPALALAPQWPGQGPELTEASPELARTKAPFGASGRRQKHRSGPGLAPNPEPPRPPKPG